MKFEFLSSNKLGFSLLGQYILAFIIRSIPVQNNNSIGILLRVFLHIFFGLTISFILYGTYALYVIIIFTLSYFLLYLPRKFVLLSNLIPWSAVFVVHFIRTCYIKSEWGSDVSGLIMFSTLRFLYLSFSVFDGKNPEKNSRENWEKWRLNKVPNIFHYYAYIFSFSGLFNGPLVPYLAWEQTLYRPSIFSITNNILKQSIIAYINAIGFGGAYAILIKHWPTSYHLSPEYLALPYFHRIFNAFCFSYIHAFRYISAWAAGEASIVILGITEQNIVDFEHCRSYRPAFYFTTRCVKEMLREWNHTIHLLWKETLFTHLLSIGCPKILGNVAVFFMSSFWHGLFAGYYIDSMIFIIVAILDDIRYAKFTPIIENLVGKKAAAVIDIIWVQFLSFFINSAWDLYFAKKYWLYNKDMHFGPYILLIILDVIGILYSKLFQKKIEKKDKNN